MKYYIVIGSSFIYKAVDIYSKYEFSEIELPNIWHQTLNSNLSLKERIEFKHQTIRELTEIELIVYGIEV